MVLYHRALVYADNAFLEKNANKIGCIYKLLVNALHNAK